MAGTGRKRSPFRDLPGWVQAIAAVVGLLAGFGVFHLSTGSSASHTSSSRASQTLPPSGGDRSGGDGKTGNPGETPSLGRQLTAAQLTAVLIPQSAYEGLPGTSADTIEADSTSYALQGGIPSLKLCNSTIQTPGLGADSSAPYEDAMSTNIYFGSDAASFAGQGAEQFLTTAAAQGPGCGWRIVPGPTLDDQTVRLTTDQTGPDNTTLHDDVILVRSGASVLEVGTAVTAGTHSSDAETLAEGAARALAQASR